MNFTPKTEAELAEAELLGKGIYPFTVMQCTDRDKDGQELKSQKGKPMAKVKLNVHGDDGFDYHVYDYISPEFMAWKFRHFWVCIGMQAQYEAGSIEVGAAVGREGWVDIDIEPAKGGFMPKNKVADYVVKEQPHEEEAPAPPPKPAKPNQTKPAAKAGKPAEEFPADDVPF